MRGAAWSSIASDTLLAFGAGTAVLMITRREKRGLLKMRKAVDALV